jgi:hypothetical protein
MRIMTRITAKAFIIVFTLFILSALSSVALSPLLNNNIEDNYSKVDATKGFELLIKGQANQVQDFENLLCRYRGQLNGANNATFLAILEDLIRRQANLHANFASILGNETHWNFTEPMDQIMFLNNYGELLENETTLYSRFYSMLSDTWCKKDFIDSDAGHCYSSMKTQVEFLYSFNELLVRQDELLGHYYSLTNNLNPGVSHKDKTRLIKDFEGLLRLQSIKIGELSNLIMNPCTK